MGLGEQNREGVREGERILFLFYKCLLMTLVYFLLINLESKEK